MTTDARSWRKVALLLLYTAVVTGAWMWWRARSAFDAEALLQTLPEARMIHVYVDFNLLRGAGFLDVLAGSKTPLEAEYIRFVKDTGFDYRTDLDAAALGFDQGKTYIAAKGRFDFARLSAYAKSQGGSCEGALCQMPGSQPTRVISFQALRPDVLALAVSPEKDTATTMAVGKWKVEPKITRAPVWIAAPGTAFQNTSALPDGSRAFLSPLAQTQRADFTLIPAPQGFTLDFNATCAAPEACSEAAAQLTQTTNLLRKMLGRDKLQPSPEDLTSILTGGQFEAKGTALTGHWPIDKRFLDKLVTDRLP
jgi:hypothetical protein